MIRKLAVFALIVFTAGSLFGQNYSGGMLIKAPLSGAAWVPPDQQQPQDKAQLDRIEQTLNRVLKLLLDAGLDQVDPAKAPAGEAPKALIEALGTCVQCHAQNVAAKKGEGFVLFLSKKGEDGKDENIFRDDFDDRELRRIIREVENGTMPKKSSGAKLSSEQKATLLAEVKSALARKGG